MLRKNLVFYQGTMLVAPEPLENTPGFSHWGMFSRNSGFLCNL
jgi:hypothetical protein